MRQREWLRQYDKTLLPQRPAWRRARAALAATVRHHPDDAAEIDFLRKAVDWLRAIELITGLHRKGELDALTTVELIGPILCPNAIAKPDRDEWGIIG